MKKFLLASVFGLSFISAVTAAETRYSSWSDPNKPAVAASQTGALVDELRKLVDEAERARAADPKFLQDLKDLAARYGAPVQKLLFSDDFSDGDFSANPVWTVSSGKYWVEKGYGLRSFVDQAAVNTTSANNSSQKVSKEELIIGVLGAVLGGKVQQQPQQQAETATADTPQAAEISTVSRISNAFEIELEFSSWVNGAALDFGPYQGTNLQTGYRLSYRSGQNPSLQLVRHYSKSSSVIGTYGNLTLEDQKNHKIVWKRDAHGHMTIDLDGVRVIEAEDQGFKDDFSGFVIRNSSGDFITKAVRISG